MLDILGAERGPVFGMDVEPAPGGMLVGRQTAEGLALGIALLEERGAPSREACRALADRFATPLFRRRFLALANRALDRG
jgi:hypothetical protein